MRCVNFLKTMKAFCSYLTVLVCLSACCLPASAQFGWIHQYRQGTQAPHTIPDDLDFTGLTVYGTNCRYIRGV